MQTQSVNLSIQSPRLAGLASRSYKDNWTSMPTDRMPAEYREVLAEIWAAVTATEFDPAASTIAISAENGVFKKLYPPKLYSTEDKTGAYIKWGATNVPVAVVDGRLTVEAPGAGYKVTMKPCKFNPSGRGEDPGVEVKAVKGKTVFSTVFSLAVVDFVGYVPGDLETAIENAPEVFFAALQSEAARQSGDNQTGELTSTGHISATCFPDGQTDEIVIEVTGVKQLEVNAKGGGKRATHILQCSPLPDLAAALPAVGEPFKLWADPSVNSVLFSDPAPVISKELPASLTIPPGGKRPYLRLSEGSIATTVGGLNLDF